jgi:hypothetical protein
MKRLRGERGYWHSFTLGLGLGRAFNRSQDDCEAENGRKFDTQARRRCKIVKRTTGSKDCGDNGEPVVLEADGGASTKRARPTAPAYAVDWDDVCFAQLHNSSGDLSPIIPHQGIVLFGATAIVPICTLCITTLHLIFPFTLLVQDLELLPPYTSSTQVSTGPSVTPPRFSPIHLRGSSNANCKSPIAAVAVLRVDIRSFPQARHRKTLT